MKYWNNGLMGFGIMQYWVNGKICFGDKTKNGEYPFRNQYFSIPLFHIRANCSNFKNCHIFSFGCRNFETLNH